MTCLYCGTDENLGVEHLVPRSRGGRKRTVEKSKSQKSLGRKRAAREVRP